MTKVLQRVEISLRSFYIFNPQYGIKEGEEYKKVLYYYPSDIELNTKIKDVGLSEAIIAFTGTFSSGDDCKALHTQKTTQLFYQPEPGYWMVLVLNVPKEIRSREGVDVTDYRGGEVHDRIYRTVLEQCYNMFRLFAGTFEMNAKAGNVEGEESRMQLQHKFELFFDKYMLSLKFPVCDIMDLTRSIQYLALDKSLFLRAHNFINVMCATFSTIKEAIFLYNEQVVCSGKIDPIDLYSLHEYIVSTIAPKVTQHELGNGALMRSNSVISEMFRNGAFITGPEWNESITKPPKVHLKRGKDLHSYKMVIYRALNATLCLFIDGDNDELQNDLYVELHSYMGPQLTSIARDIGEVLSKQQGNGKQQAGTTGGLLTAAASSDSADAVPKYIFINEQSLKHLSNISVEKRRSKCVPNVPINVMNIIADLSNEQESSSSDVVSSMLPSFEEVQVKTTNDFWIVKKRCNWRQYYVIIFNSKATLLDVTNEAKKIFEQELTDDVFFDK